MKERPGDLVYALYANTDTNRPRRPRSTSAATATRPAPPHSPPTPGRTSPPPTTAASLRLYVNGTQVGAARDRRLDHDLDRRAPHRRQHDLGRVVQRPDRRGAGLQPRADARPRSRRDMNAADHEPRHRPADRARHADRDRLAHAAQLTWAAATDNVGVARYNVHRGTTAGLHAVRANRIAQPTGTSYTDTASPPAPTTTGHRRGRRRQRRRRLERGDARSSGDTQAPTAPGTLTATGSRRPARRSRGAPRPTTSASPATTSTARRPRVHADAGEPDRAADRARATSTRVAAGTYYYRVTAEDAAGNVGAASNEASAVVTGDTQRRRRADQPDGDRSPAAPSNLSWTAATDNVGVTRYNVHRATTRRLHAERGEPDRAAHRHELHRHRARDRHLLLPGDGRGRGRQRRRRVRTRRRAVVTDATAPTAPEARSDRSPARRSRSRWTAATDNVGVTRYNLHRSTTSGFTPSAANRIAQPTEPATPTPASRLARTSTAHRRGRRRQRRPRLEHGDGDRGRHDRADRADRLDRDGRLEPGARSAGRRRPTTSASRATTSTARRRSGFTPSAANRIAQPTGTSYTDTGLAAGTYYYRVTAEDAAGNVSAPSTQATATVSTAPPVGLVAAYGFDEGTGTTTATSPATQQRHDRERHLGRRGRRQVRQRAHLQRHEQHRQRPRLELARPHDRHDARGLGAADHARHSWRTVILKEQPGYYAYALYANTGTNRPERQRRHRRHDRDLRGTAALAAEHLDAPRRDLRRHDARALRQRRPGRDARCTTGAIVDLDRRAPDRRQHALGRVLRRPDRRGPHLQPRAQRNRDPDRHEPHRHQPRHDAADARRRTSFAQVAPRRPSPLRGRPRPTTSASPSTGSIETACQPAPRPRPRSRSRASPAARARTSKSTRATRSGTCPRGVAHGRDGRLRRHTADAPGHADGNGLDRPSTLSWGAATDNVGVARYNVHRGTTPASRRRRQPDRAADRHELHRLRPRRARTTTGSPPRTPRATSAPPSNEANATATADTTAPTAPTSAHRDRRQPTGRR